MQPKDSLLSQCSTGSAIYEDQVDKTKAAAGAGAADRATTMADIFRICSFASFYEYEYSNRAVRLCWGCNFTLKYDAHSRSALTLKTLYFQRKILIKIVNEKSLIFSVIITCLRVLVVLLIVLVVESSLALCCHRCRHPF